MNSVFVLDTNKQPLDPTNPGRARILLTRGKATGVMPLSITAYGHGCRQMQNVDKFGFPSGKPKAKKFKHGFKTGDIVKALVPKHLKNAGTHVGRISAKAVGSFTIATAKGTVPDIGKNYCRKLQRADGYGYSQRRA